jgi:hypothetical protein
MCSERSSTSVSLLLGSDSSAFWTTTGRAKKSARWDQHHASTEGAEGTKHGWRAGFEKRVEELEEVDCADYIYLWVDVRIRYRKP